MFTTRLMVAAVALTLAAVVAPAQAAQRYGWTPSVELSAAGQHAWDPEVAYSENGDAVFVWNRYTGSDYVGQMVTRSAAGTLGSVRRLADPSTQGLEGPKVAIDDAGNALIAWTRWDGADWRVQARSLEDGVLGDIETLSDFGENASAPELAVNAEGEGVVTWTRTDDVTGNPMVEARTMSTAGDVGGLEVISDSGQEARGADVGIDGDGDAVLVWERYDVTDNLILTRWLDSDGTLNSERTLSLSGNSAQEPHVAINDAGAVAYAWTRSDGTNVRVQGRVDLIGAPLDSIMTLSASGQSADEARAAIDASGDSLFSWTRWDGDDWRVQTVRLPAGGVPDAVESQSANGGHASNAEIAIEPDGTAAIAWTRWDAATQETEAQVRKLPANGGVSATVTRSSAGEDPSEPHVAVRSGGTIMLTYEAFDGAYRRIKYSKGAPEGVLPDDVLTPTGGGHTAPGP